MEPLQPSWAFGMADVEVGDEAKPPENLDTTMIDSDTVAPSLAYEATEPHHLGMPHDQLKPSTPEHCSAPPPDLNFSRKRGHQAVVSVGSIEQPGTANAPGNHTPKRLRSDNWPLVDENGTPLQDSAAWEHNSPPTEHKRHVSNPSKRPSKFKEETMKDRASDKPPSMFLRVFNQDSNSAKTASVDQLMEDYMATTNDSATVRVPGGAAIRDTQLKALTQHPNASISSANHPENTKSAGIFQFGRSIASAFNPFKLFKKGAKQNEVRDEVIEDDHTKQLHERQAKAEAAYAELKKSGQLYSLGTRPVSHNVTPPLPPVDTGATAPNESKNRDSGIDMDEGSPLESFDSTRNTSMTSGTPSLEATRPWKSPFVHIKTPSLSNLRKRASEAALNGRRTPSFMHDVDMFESEHGHGLRRSQSRKDIKKDMARTQKLTKRVSDLEAKLEAARRELNLNVSPHAPPVPALPATPKEYPRHFNNRRGDALRNGFPVACPLPSLASERTLLLEQVVKPDEETILDAANTRLSPIQSDSPEMLTKWELNVGEEPEGPATSPAAILSLHFPPAPSRPAPAPPVAGTLTSTESAKANHNTESQPSGLTSFEYPGNFPPVKPSSIGPIPFDKSPPGNKSPPKKKRKPGDHVFKPGRISSDDDAEWETAALASKKSKETAVTTSTGSPAKTRLKKKPVTSSGGVGFASLGSPTKMTQSDNVFVADAKKKALRSSIKNGSASPNKNEDMDSPHPRTSLETVHEEISITLTTDTSTTSIPISDIPAKPTASATPSHPGKLACTATRSLSPVKMGRPAGHVAAVARMGAGSVGSRRRSTSPLKKEVKMGRSRLSEDDEVASGTPDGPVPRIPGQGTGTGKEGTDDDFDWERDTF